MDNDKLLEMLQRIDRGVARSEANTENLKEYIGKVSLKVDGVEEKVDNHMLSLDAHGAGAVQRNGTNFVSWLGLLVAGISLLAVLVPLLRARG